MGATKTPVRRSAASQAQQREARRQWSRDRTSATAEIGDLPEVADHERRERCRDDLFAFLTTYFPGSTSKHPFSSDHRLMIERMQSAIQGGGRVVNAIYRGAAKALAIDTPIPTPRGWSAMGALAVGDQVYGSNGEPCRVVGATPIMRDTDCYEVKFGCGQTVKCSGDHLWRVWDRASRKTRVIDTRNLLSGHRYRYGDGRNEARYSVPVCGALSKECKGPHPISPYVLGVWLGDGHSANNRVTCADADSAWLLREMEKEGESVRASKAKRTSNARAYTVGAGPKLAAGKRDSLLFARQLIDSGLKPSDVQRKTGLSYRAVCGMKYLGRWSAASLNAKPTMGLRLREAGVLGNKHIPKDYIECCESCRMSIIQGLMDTDGTIGYRGECSFSNKNELLCDQLAELLSSVGIKPSKRSHTTDGTRYFTIAFKAFSDRPVFRMERKRSRQVDRKKSVLCETRSIVKVRNIPSIPVRCIEVDAEDSMYLCTRSMIPTHNSTCSENAAIWALLYGHASYIVIVAMRLGLAADAIDAVKMEIAENDLLAADFPEVCHAVHALEGKPQRCKSQTYQGESTHIVWKADTIVLPTIPGSVASGAILTARPISKARGVKHRTADGRQVRPDLAIVDDPQDEESAASAARVKKNLAILKKDICQAGGHGKRIAVVVNATVIYQDDMIEQLLADPAWNGKRIGMVKSWADAHDEKWMGEYAVRRRDYDKGDALSQQAAAVAANEYYAANREAMDAGCVVSWEWCYDQDSELSAIQHAYNALIDYGDEVFQSEYQNEPAAPHDDEGEQPMTVEAICAKQNGLPHGVVPSWAQHVVGFIDVQKDLLYYAVLAAGDGFRASVIDYGAWPKQRLPRFQLREAGPTIAEATGRAGLEESLRAALDTLSDDLCGREWKREDTAAVKMSRLLVDANWAQSTDTVYEWARASKHAAIILPSHGRYLGATSREWDGRKPVAGEINGSHWRIPNTRESRRPFRHIYYDTNYWKSFTFSRLAVGIGGRGSLEFFGRAGEVDHTHIAEHLTAERRIAVSAQGRTVDEWKHVNTMQDNHWFDCVVGCMVAASVAGVMLDGVQRVSRKPRYRTFEQMAGR